MANGTEQIWWNAFTRSEDGSTQNGRPQATSGTKDLGSLIENIIEVGENEEVTVDDLIHAVGEISFLPLLLLPAIALATPLSGIPMFSSMMGVIIFLVTIQMMMRRNHVWLPRWLLNRKVKRARVQSAFQRLKPVTDWIDRRAHKRLRTLTSRPISVIPLILILLSGLFLPLLEFVPFSSSLVGFAIALMAYGLLMRDGLILIVALLPYVGVGWLLIRYL